MNYISGLIFMYGTGKNISLAPQSSIASKCALLTALLITALSHFLGLPLGWMSSLEWSDSSPDSVSDPPLRFFLLAFRPFSAGSLSTSRRASLRCRFEVLEPFPPEELLFWFFLFLGSNLQSFVKCVRPFSRRASSLKHQAQPFAAEEMFWLDFFYHGFLSVELTAAFPSAIVT